MSCRYEFFKYRGTKQTTNYDSLNESHYWHLAVIEKRNRDDPNGGDYFDHSSHSLEK